MILLILSPIALAATIAALWYALTGLLMSVIHWPLLALIGCACLGAARFATTDRKV